MNHQQTNKYNTLYSSCLYHPHSGHTLRDKKYLIVSIIPVRPQQDTRKRSIANNERIPAISVVVKGL